MKICSQCGCEKENIKILNDKYPDICCSCIYKNKCEKIIPEEKVCPICESNLPSTRWVYCCTECAYIGNAKKKETYWTKLINYPKVSWRSKAPAR